MYADRPQPTPLAIEAEKRRAAVEREYRRRKLAREGGQGFFDGRYPTLTDREEDSRKSLSGGCGGGNGVSTLHCGLTGLTERTLIVIKLREKLEKATDRDQVRRIRDQMKVLEGAGSALERLLCNTSMRINHFLVTQLPCPRRSRTRRSNARTASTRAS